MQVKNQCLSPVAVPHLSGSARVFRCGQCVNCLRQKANELAVRAYREYKGQNLAFITFTYNNEHMPMLNYEADIDVHTGEIRERTWISRGGSFFKDAPFDFQRKNAKGYEGKRFKPYKRLYELNSNMHKLQVQYFTVFYEDVKLLFKRFRERFPKALNHFICVPEYGSVTYRPHYHLLAFGLTNEQISALAHDWEVEHNLGHVDIRYPDSAKELMTEQVQKIGMYIAKYCTKGKFDCPYIKQGYCLKPRRAISQNFGIGNDFEKLKQIVLCTKELGINDPWFNDDCPPDLNKWALSLLVSRRSMKIGSAEHMPFPKYLLNKIFKKTYRVEETINRVEDLPEIEGVRNMHTQHNYEITELTPDTKRKIRTRGHKVSYKSVASPLQKAITGYLLADLVNNALRKQREGARSLGTVSEINQYFQSLSENEQIALAAAERQFVSDLYNNSYF